MHSPEALMTYESAGRFIDNERVDQPRTQNSNHFTFTLETKLSACKAS